MSRRDYVPDRGDVIWIDFEPQAGKEIAKRRPGLVLSPAVYNKFGLALICPVTTKIKGRKFEVPMQGNVKSVILSDQMRSLDWLNRNAEFKEKVAPEIVKAVIQRLAVLLV